MENKKVLLVFGHPNKDSYNYALFNAYKKGLEKANADIRAIELFELNFDPILHKGYKEQQELEPDLIQAQKDILWAEHIVFFYPTWWGTMPALLKGFFDRILLPGFAYQYTKGKKIPRRLLKGKSVRVITTMGGPIFWDYFVYGNSGQRIINKAILHFCGITKVKTTKIGNLTRASQIKKKNWLKKIEQLGNNVK